MTAPNASPARRHDADEITAPTPSIHAVQSSAHIADAPPQVRVRFWRNEDWLAAFLGLVVIAAVLAGVRPDIPKFKWATDAAVAAKIAEQRPATDALVADAAAKGSPEVSSAATALRTALDSGERSSIAAAAKVLGDAAKATKDPSVKKKGAAVSKSLADAGSSIATVFSARNLKAAAVIGLAFLLLSTIGIALLGGNVRRYAIGFPAMYVLASLAQVVAGNSTVSYWGLEYVIFALVIGLFIGNVTGVPGWLREAVRTEYFIKAGLVILGTSILFSEILQAGALGILQAVLVVSVVWYACFWLARKLKVDDEFAVILSTAVSICGVSAAIAACGAIKGDKRKLSYVTSLVLIVAVPMMVLMPWAVRTLGIPDVVGGAWLGGTLDTSGSVVAAGALISESAMKTGVIVKFSQNVLLGVAAFGLSVWWTLRRGRFAGSERPSGRVIWERFPKFVLGFVAASLVFSFALEPATIEATKGALGALRTALFAIAFLCIGLETRVSNLISMQGGRPAAAFVLAQGFNVVWTLALAFAIFGGFFFAVPMLK
jgi:uncharacterized integral membrane protein (TIGR00698 family)